MILFLDPSLSGISGDMFLGACIDAGLNPDGLEHDLRLLNLEHPWQLSATRAERGSIAGTKLDFLVEEPESDAHGRHFSQIRDLIAASGLKQPVKDRAIEMFKRLGLAEASVHGKDLEAIHFHEVGAMDSILDIVGAAIALDQLGVSEVRSSVPVDGSGTIECAHGTFPVPAPAVVALLQGLPFHQTDVQAELITPTGATILAECVSKFGPLGPCRITASGYGLGSRELEGRPNVLRVLLAEANTPAGSGPEDFLSEEILLLESNVDDATGEELGAVIETLLENGALDVTLTPCLMKKGRPGTLIQVLASPLSGTHLTRLLHSLTGTLGIRTRLQHRWILPREIRTISTSFGPIRVKGTGSGPEWQPLKPEFDDLKQAAQKYEVPVETVNREAWRVLGS